MNLLNSTTTEIILFNTVCSVKNIKNWSVKNIKKIDGDCFEIECYARLINNKGEKVGYVDVYVPRITKEGVCLPALNFIKEE